MNKYTNASEAVQFLRGECEKMGVDVNGLYEVVKNVVDVIPQDELSNYGTDPVIQAANFYPQYMEKMASASAMPVIQSSAPVGFVPSAKPVITSDQNKRIKDIVTASYSEKQARSRNSEIDKLIFKQPSSKTLISESGVKEVVISLVKEDRAANVDRKTLTAADEILKSYESKLNRTDENVAAFEKVKAAYYSNTPVPVYEGSDNMTLNGLRVRIADGSDAKTTVWKKEKAMCDLVENFAMGIEANKFGVSVRVGSSKKKSTAANFSGQKVEQEVTTLKFTGVKDAKTNPEAFETIRQIHREGGQVVKSEKAVPIFMSFQVHVYDKTTGKPKVMESDPSKPILRTVRLKGYASIPEVKAMDKDLLDVFGDDTKTAAFEVPKYQADIDKAVALQTKLMANLVTDSSIEGQESSTISELKAMFANSNANTVGNDMV